MKRLPKYLLISLLTFSLSMFAVFYWYFSRQQLLQFEESKTAEVSKNPTDENRICDEPTDYEFRTPLDDIWIEDENLSYEGYIIQKECLNDESLSNNCRIIIKKGKKILAEFESSRDYWLTYGFFNFLGETDKQIIVLEYSGGAHCCYDYYIYDLKPTFREIYSTAKFDSGSEIGNQLIPTDIDGDGIFEFRQDIMAFDYFYASHADSVFPPAVFAYNKETRKYEVANKRFPDYVLRNTQETLEWFDKYKINRNGGKCELDAIDKRYISKTTFLNLIYSGNENEAWKYFDENYRFEDKEDYRRDIKKIFADERIFKSIYGK